MEKERWVSSECEQHWSEERSPWLPSTAAARCTALLSLLLLWGLRLCGFMLLCVFLLLLGRLSL